MHAVSSTPVQGYWKHRKVRSIRAGLLAMWGYAGTNSPVPGCMKLAGWYERFGPPRSLELTSGSGHLAPRAYERGAAELTAYSPPFPRSWIETNSGTFPLEKHKTFISTHSRQHRTPTASSSQQPSCWISSFFPSPSSSSASPLFLFLSFPPLAPASTVTLSRQLSGKYCDYYASASDAPFFLSFFFQLLRGANGGFLLFRAGAVSIDAEGNPVPNRWNVCTYILLEESLLREWTIVMAPFIYWLGTFFCY